MEGLPLCEVLLERLGPGGRGDHPLAFRRCAVPARRRRQLPDAIVSVTSALQFLEIPLSQGSELAGTLAGCLIAPLTCLGVRGIAGLATAAAGARRAARLSFLLAARRLLPSLLAATRVAALLPLLALISLTTKLRHLTLQIGKPFAKLPGA
jgi:hypothetical protein